MSITSDNTLKGTCCVCGKTTGMLGVGLPPLPGMGAGTCPKCGKSVCGDHMQSHTKTCGKVDADNKGDWCKTPKMFP